MKNVIQTLAKSVLISLGLTAAASTAVQEYIKKILESGRNTTLIISNKEIEGILGGVSETIKNEAKEQKGEFLSML